ncbi:MAG: hypothetical protein CSB55_02060 [Candidatus Cloacimonadota bacterium]|nr:MAG: hypothetical protein CSB55_02060 [Candidatus Cloacimonadota bacterium]
MKKITLLICLALIASTALAIDTGFKMSGTLRNRMQLWTNYNPYAAAGESSFEKDGHTRNNADTRLRWKFQAHLDSKVKAVWQVEIGDIVWGKNGGKTGTDGVNVETKHAYLQYVYPKSNFGLRIGLQGWHDHRSLIFDSDFAALKMMYNFKEAKLAMYFAKDEEGDYDADDDSDLFILTAKNKLLGADIVVSRKASGKDMNYWIMPYVTMEKNELKFDGMLGFNFGNVEGGALDGSGEDLTNFGYAVALNAQYDAGTKIKADVLLTSGDDGEDPESSSKFNVMRSYYMNGLQILGYGINDSWGIAPGNDGIKQDAGTLTFALSAEYPVKEDLKIFGAFGMANTMEKVAEETNIGTEFNLGICKRIYKPLSVKAVAAYMIPGKIYDGSDNIMRLATLFQYDF